MPHKQRHRGAQSEDHVLFRAAMQPLLRAAVYDYSFLLSRGYSEDALFKLVGDRYQLTQRQRYAVMRAACSTQSLHYRHQHEMHHPQQADWLLVDGFNLLITIESALSGGCLFEGRDGSLRDLSSIHATYKRVTETVPAIHLIGQFAEAQHLPPLYWYLDKPVSNSGRLKQHLEAEARTNARPWEVELVGSPDYCLKQAEFPVVTTDSYVLDKASQWLNLGQWLVRQAVSNPWIVSLKPDEEGLDLQKHL